ncbi:Receptor-like protein 52 [Linum perenne]
MLPSLFPSGFGNLSSLTHLNLSRAEFRDPIPEHDISHLKKLVSLDLTSYNEDASVDMEKLVKNLTQLKVLRLDGVDLSRTINNKSWSTLPADLQELSLRNCNFTGKLPDSIHNLASLEELHLDNCIFHGVIPSSINTLTELRSLSLSGNNFSGPLLLLASSSNIQYLGFSSNNFNVVGLDLSMSFIGGGINGSSSIFHLRQAYNDMFSSLFPFGFGNLSSLTHLNLSRAGFGGPIPEHDISRFEKLVSLDLTSSNRDSSVDMEKLVKNLTQLKVLRLDDVDLSRTINNKSWSTLPADLQELSLKGCQFHGRFPNRVFLNPNLRIVEVRNNSLITGTLPEFPIGNNLLQVIDLSDTKFSGKLPDSIHNLASLEELHLDNCMFHGVISSSINTLTELQYLGLSGNNFSGSIPLSYDKFQDLVSLDLSNNNLGGNIPPSLFSLPNLDVLALSSNQLEGQLEVFHNSSSELRQIDLSHNKLQGHLPMSIFNTRTLEYLSVAFNNNIKGYIPPSICYMKDLEILDLSTNHINGFIPPCLTSLPYLHVLSLRDNQLTGMLPGGFAPTCTLRTFDVNQNHLNGELSKSLGLCKDLEVVDAGKNYLTGKFPLWLENLPLLRILILHSNHFGGTIESKNSSGFPLLQIFDVSSNKFVGRLPLGWFTSWKEMMKQSTPPEYPGISHYSYYQDSITVTDKGIEREYGKILTSFVLIDVSNNKFTGEIPEAIARLESIHLLNLSNNHFTGHIPVSFGQLSQLESLDLSSNNLSGNIPPQLTKLTFMSKLNLSHNSLTGEIPRGFQFENFEPESYEGNPGLCGKPLPKSCYNVKSTPLSSKPDDEDEGGHGFIDWEYYRLGIECGVGTGLVLGFVVAYLVFGNFLVHQRRIRRYVIRPLRT